MEIPYIVRARPDTGVNNGKLGIWLFLASEVMLFGALFATYIMLRVGSTDWPAGTQYLDVKMATINTIILITSSVTMVMAWASLMRRRFGTYQLYMAATVLLGFGFMVVKFFEYSAKFEHHYYPSTHTFLAIYFTLTGLHGLHVLGGMVVNAYFALFGKKMWEQNPQWLTNRVENSGLFWHFVDLVWIFLFPILYLLRSSLMSDHVDIDHHVRNYLLVFGALMVLTVITVGAWYFLELSVPATIAVALIIATIKASLVACVFMHLISEKKLIYWVMGLTVAFFVLLLVPVLTSLFDAVVS